MRHSALMSQLRFRYRDAIILNENIIITIEGTQNGIFVTVVLLGSKQRVHIDHECLGINVQRIFNETVAAMSSVNKQ